MAKKKIIETELTHTIRHADEGTITLNSFTKDKAIKCMCSECMGFEERPEDCTDFKCPLFPYRGTTLLNRVRFDDEKMKEKKERMKATSLKYWEKQSNIKTNVSKNETAQSDSTI